MAGKKAGLRHTEEFRRAAVERMKASNNITALAKELGVERRLLYNWWEKLEPEKAAARKTGPRRPEAEERAQKLEQEVNRLKRALGEKALELDFFKGALRRIEERRRQSEAGGEPPSTTRSGKR